MPLIKAKIVSCWIDESSLEDLLDKYDIDYDYLEVSEDRSEINIYCDNDDIDRVSTLLKQLGYKVLYC